MNMFNISFLWMEISVVGGGSFYFYFFFFLCCSPFGRFRPFFFWDTDTTKVFEQPADVRKEQKESVLR